MAKYLVDVNLPYYFSLWDGEDFIHQADLGDTWIRSTELFTEDFLEERNQPDESGDSCNE